MVAKKATAGAKPKAKKAVKASVGGVSIKVKAKAKKPKKAKTKKSEDTVHKLAKLAESPIVSDLIAVGASAAVAAIAAGLANKSGKTGNTDAVKKAGKAAAAAIGARLVEEFKAVKDAAEEAGKKRA